MDAMLASFRCLAVALPVIATIAAVAVPESVLAAKADTVGLVKQVKNDAFGTPPGAGREKKLLRFPVAVDELLETDKQANMLVEFLDETTLALGQNSRLRVDTMVYDPNARKGALVVDLTVGSFRFVSGKLQGGEVRLVTPSMILGIRGSDAMIVVSPDGATTVSVFSGVFSISNRAGAALAVVTAAKAVSVSGTGVIGAVVDGPTQPPIELSIPAKRSDPDHGLDKAVDAEGYGGDVRTGRRIDLPMQPRMTIQPSIPSVPSSPMPSGPPKTFSR
ncbi:MAG: hypothetical protein EXQ86_10215 [Rhodospirillales bacterium]|nr:hypothetical protein [Rhodospirillales bacterium]